MREAFVDADVALRFLTNEPRDLADRAAFLLEKAEREGIPVVLSSVTVAEMVYVLRSVYKWTQAEVTNRLIDLIAAEVFALAERDVIVQALLWCRDISGIHFGEAYLAALASAHDERTLLSFDRAVKKIPHVRVIDDLADWGENGAL